ncbi:MAG: HlyC/CorC family transporter [Deltaproteobacteria bacterium]|nr:HlyC/CorC family transporter [Deltaproteobacteria bacterium]
MPSFDLLALLLALALVALNGFFVATEFAIVKVRPTRIEELIRKHRPGARTTRHMISNIDAYLSAAQLGITLASLGLGWVGEPAFARLIAPHLHTVGISDPVWVDRIALAAAFSLLTLLHIVVGEQAPKFLAIFRAEAVALAIAYPMRLFYTLCLPLIWPLNGLARLALRLAGVAGMRPGADYHSEEELKIIVSQARSAGLLSAARSDVLRRAMSLPTKNARTLMVPRGEVAFLDINETFEENLARASDSGHARFPLCDRELDDVLGIVDIREILFKARHGPIDLRALAAPAVYLPELMSGERLLAEFRARRIPMAVVVDEYGGASGIVTPADVVAAVMGEFEEEDDTYVKPLPGGAYDVEGTVTLEEIENVLKVSLSIRDMRTVGGFLMTRLGRMPKVGDKVIEAAHVFNVIEVHGPRIAKIRIQRETPRDQRAAPPPTK